MLIQQHVLENPGLQVLVNPKELLNVVPVDDVFRFLLLAAVQLDLPVLFEGDSGYSSEMALHHVCQPLQEHVRELRDLDELTQAAFLSPVDHRYLILVRLLVSDLPKSNPADLPNKVLPFQHFFASKELLQRSQIIFRVLVLTRDGIRTCFFTTLAPSSHWQTIGFIIWAWLGAVLESTAIAVCVSVSSAVLLDVY